MSKTEFIDQKKLEDISLQARLSPRLRKNYNFHHADRDICHRLLNAMEPDSYIQPHRHLDMNKDETLIVVRGRMAIIIFDDTGKIEEKAILEPGGDVLMASIPHGIYHTWLSLEERSVFFEAKGGPFLPLAKDEKAPWAPEEGEKEVKAYLASLKEAILK
jgi:cupin fold WbuC family metalloprotein